MRARLGFGLVDLLIASAAIAGLSLVVFRLFGTTAETQARVSTSALLDAQLNAARRALMLEENCEKMFYAPPPLPHLEDILRNKVTVPTLGIVVPELLGIGTKVGTATLEKSELRDFFQTALKFTDPREAETIASLTLTYRDSTRAVPIQRVLPLRVHWIPPPPPAPGTPPERARDESKVKSCSLATRSLGILSMRCEDGFVLQSLSVDGPECVRAPLPLPLAFQECEHGELMTRMGTNGEPVCKPRLETKVVSREVACGATASGCQISCNADEEMVVPRLSLPHSWTSERTLECKGSGLCSATCVKAEG